jgi:hypothetical protein
MTKRISQTDRTAAAEGKAPTDAVRDGADALFRAAIEACRQRERLSRMHDVGANQAEQRAALKLAQHCDEQLIEAVLAYEKAARNKPAGNPEWWHRANILWMASREYERRHRCADDSSKRLDDRTSATLGKLAMDYDLEASALLALQHVVEDYRKCRPEAELFERGKR